MYVDHPYNVSYIELSTDMEFKRSRLLDNRFVSVGVECDGENSSNLGLSPLFVIQIIATGAIAI